MKKNFKLYAVAWAICLVLFNIICFVSPNEAAGMTKFGGAFWAGYIFITIGFIGQLFCAYLAFKAENSRKLFYNISLITISYSGLVLMIVIGSLAMAIPNLPNWVGVIACAIILAANAVSIIKATAAIEEVSRIDEKVKAQTFFIKSLTVDAESLMARAASEPIKAECRKVYEAVRYSDPMSNDALASVEGQITVKFAELSEAVKADYAEAVAEIANEVIILVDDRNKKCKLCK